MNKLLKLLIIICGFMAVGKIAYASSPATLEKLPNSSYSKLCYQGKCALYDNFDKEIVTELQYDDIKCLDDTPYMKVKINGKWAIYYLYNDREITLPIYDDIESIRANGSKYLIVKQGDKWAVFYTIKSKLLTGYIYESFKRVDSDFDFDTFKVKSFDKYGFITFGTFNVDDCDFDYVPAIYDEAEMFTATIFKVKEDDKWALYDAKIHKPVTLFEYDDIKYKNGNFRGQKDGAWVDIKL
jgi:hypothetical protein